MAGVYDEIELVDLDFDDDDLIYYYPCPCGDRFFIALEDLWDGEDIAGCPSCTLTIRILFDSADLPPLPSDEDEYPGEANAEPSVDAQDAQDAQERSTAPVEELAPRQAAEAAAEAAAEDGPRDGQAGTQDAQGQIGTGSITAIDQCAGDDDPFALGSIKEHSRPESHVSAS